MQAQYIEACFKTFGQNSPKDVQEAISFWQYQQVWERLLGLKEAPFTQTAKRFRPSVIKGSDNFDDYVEMSQRHSEHVINATYDLFDDISPSITNALTPVQWQD